ncbi:hypothetical protein [Paraburkholderia fungorum]|nr:hypothetical protein [Paraburkholderia fungorum]
MLAYADAANRQRAASLLTKMRAVIAAPVAPTPDRNAILEEAAKLCDEREDWYVKDDCRGQACAAAGCANDIRALAATAQSDAEKKS